MSSISTDTATLRRILSDCHLKCNKEWEIATLDTKMEKVEKNQEKTDAKLDTMDVKLDEIGKYITESKAEKNTIAAVIGFISAGIGMFFGSKL